MQKALTQPQTENGQKEYFRPSRKNCIADTNLIVVQSRSSSLVVLSKVAAPLDGVKHINHILKVALAFVGSHQFPPVAYQSETYTRYVIKGGWSSIWKTPWFDELLFQKYGHLQ